LLAISLTFWAFLLQQELVLSDLHFISKARLLLQFQAAIFRSGVKTCRHLLLSRSPNGWGVAPASKDHPGPFAVDRHFILHRPLTGASARLNEGWFGPFRRAKFPVSKGFAI
jgi:hypothetical protein